MTIRTENNNVAVRFPTTDKRTKKVWCTDTGEWWNSAKECAKEVGVSYSMLIDTLNGNHRTCKGKHYSYEENVTETTSRMGERVRHMSEFEQKAVVYDNIQSAAAHLNQLKAKRDKLNAEIAEAEWKLNTLLKGGEINA